jgi:hypothetical protein
MRFTYSSGQKPLEGYTIKRGIGRGGFGEVYYALSDGGKEVALKLVCSNLDIELRGMTQCLNLKHPNLVNLYDLRNDPQGNHWVVMEYIAGDPLGVILSRYPDGLPVELAREWFLGLAAAVGYLHDHGIVHRDLKPGNIFIENGQVKVGDYGLSKFIGGSQRTAQTQSVGTVHYMAPEISTGNYNRQIDIYASGILLYEMLTGRVPFEGESAGEILMKHLTSPPDLRKVPSPFVPILDKALSKNPAHRFRTMAEMGREVTATGGEGPALGALQPRALVSRETLPLPPPVAAETAPPLPVRSRVAELCGSLLLAVGLAALFAILWAAVNRTSDPWQVANYFFLTVACCWAVLVPAKFWATPVDDSWRRRLALMGVGLCIGLLAVWLQGYPLPEFGLNQAHASSLIPEEEFAQPGGRSFFFRRFSDDRALPLLAGYLTYFALIFFVMRWWKLADRRRPQRFSMYAVLMVGVMAYLLVFLVLGQPRQTPKEFVALVMSAVIIQLVSPWEQPAPNKTRRLRLRYA